MLDFDEFKNNCLKGHCARHTIISPQCLKDYKIKKCYNKVLDKIDTRIKDVVEFQTKDILKWKELKATILERDKSCRLFKVCTLEEKEILYSKTCYGNFGILDGAHVFSRGSNLQMKYDIDNVYILSRYAHTCIDNYLNPFTEKYMGKEGNKIFWIKIIGEEKYNELEVRSMKIVI